MPKQATQAILIVEEFLPQCTSLLHIGVGGGQQTHR
jgi:hypothetical protein